MLLLHEDEPVTPGLQHKYQPVLYIIGNLNYRLDCVFCVYNYVKNKHERAETVAISYVVFAYVTIYRGTHDCQLCIIVGDVV
jgi:hypothetical protein